MTSLTDKMEGLRKDTPNEFDIGSERSTPKIIRDNGFNQALNVCIALSLAEEAVVGDWEARFDRQFVKHQYSNVEPTFIDPVGDVGPIKAFIRDLLAAKDREREAGATEYRQFILNVLDGIDIADGEGNTKAIRLAIASRII